MQFGYSVNGYGVGDLVKVVNEVTESDAGKLVSEYEASYNVPVATAKRSGLHKSLHEAARIELGLRAFLTGGGFSGFTDTFEDLHGLGQLPGIAAQRLMADGFGFGAEGDWKTCALVRAMKVMASGLKGRHLFYGGLHVSLRCQTQFGARSAYARDLPLDRAGQAFS
jgi:L-arabinose isomerase